MDEEMILVETELNSTQSEIELYLSVLKTVSTEGICRDDVIALEGIYETTEITDEIPLKGFSAHRSNMNTEIALEGLLDKTVKAMRRGAKIVWDALLKIVRAVHKALQKPFGPDVVADKLYEDPVAWRAKFNTELDVYVERGPQALLSVRTILQDFGDIFSYQQSMMQEYIEFNTAISEIYRRGSWERTDTVVEAYTGTFNDYLTKLHGYFSMFGSGLSPAPRTRVTKNLSMNNPYVSPDMLVWARQEMETFKTAAATKTNVLGTNVRDVAQALPMLSQIESANDRVTDLVGKYEEQLLDMRKLVDDSDHNAVATFGKINMQVGTVPQMGEIHEARTAMALHMQRTMMDVTETLNLYTRELHIIFKKAATVRAAIDA